MIQRLRACARDSRRGEQRVPRALAQRAQRMQLACRCAMIIAVPAERRDLAGLDLGGHAAARQVARRAARHRLDLRRDRRDVRQMVALASLPGGAV